MYKSHPAAAVMPPLSDTEYAAMVTSIKKDGLIDAIKLIDDLVIDGNHRQTACQDAGVEPRYEQIETDDPVQFVLSCDTRRHMTKQQRSAVAAELASMELGDNQRVSKITNPVSEQDAADLMGVSKSSVTKAKKVMREDPEKHEAIKRGEKVKAKPKPKKEKRIGWQKIAIDNGLISGTSGGSRDAAKKELLSFDPEIVLTAGGLLPGMAARVNQACIEIVRRRNPEKAKQDAERTVDEVSPFLSMSAGKRLETAIRAHKRVLDAEHEYHLQKRIKEELNRILPGYRKRDQEHLDTINAYKGVLSRAEYKLVLGLLHSDNLPGIDELRRARYDKAFDLVKRKERWLCGLKESDKVKSSLPETVEELLKRRR